MVEMNIDLCTPEGTASTITRSSLHHCCSLWFSIDASSVLLHLQMNFCSIWVCVRFVQSVALIFFIFDNPEVANRRRNYDRNNNTGGVIHENHYWPYDVNWTIKPSQWYFVFLFKPRRSSATTEQDRVAKSICYLSKRVYIYESTVATPTNNDKWNEGISLLPEKIRQIHRRTAVVVIIRSETSLWCPARLGVRNVSCGRPHSKVVNVITNSSSSYDNKLWSNFRVDRVGWACSARI